MSDPEFQGPAEERIAALEAELKQSRQRIAALEVDVIDLARYRSRAAAAEKDIAAAAATQQRQIRLVHDSRADGRVFRRMIITEAYRCALELGPVPAGAEFVVRVPSGISVGRLGVALRGFSFFVAEQGPLDEHSGAWLAVAPAPAASPHGPNGNGGPPPRRAA